MFVRGCVRGCVHTWMHARVRSQILRICTCSTLFASFVPRSRSSTLQWWRMRVRYWHRAIEKLKAVLYYSTFSDIFLWAVEWRIQKSGWACKHPS
uniref:Uncharacterized protein n=1 Tax=Anguilla anguilla TaxID=7936 RepID=A0A0E9PRX9_ANGAN